MLRGSQGLTRGAQGRQTRATEAAWRRLWAPWGLPGEALGPLLSPAPPPSPFVSAFGLALTTANFDKIRRGLVPQGV